MTISTLERTPLDEIVTVFNKAFSDYKIKVSFTEDSFKQKISLENISLNYSVGAFENGQLIGFVLNGFDYRDGKKSVYNAGTGVVPAFRGKGITEELYDYMFPLFQKQSLQQGILEVLENNTTAIHVYLKLGYQIKRDLTSFTGVVHFNKLPTIKDVRASLLDTFDWNLITTFWNIQPSWQNSTNAIERSKDLFKFIGIFRNEHLIGYGIINPDNGKIAQFGVDRVFRKMGVGQFLFNCLAKVTKSKLSVFNVDQSDTETIDFLTKVGMKPMIRQFEMTMDLQNIKKKRKIESQRLEIKH